MRWSMTYNHISSAVFTFLPLDQGQLLQTLRSLGLPAAKATHT